jgi:hypothetical protein
MSFNSPSKSMLSTTVRALAASSTMDNSRVCSSDR